MPTQIQHTRETLHPTSPFRSFLDKLMQKRKSTGPCFLLQYTQSISCATKSRQKRRQPGNSNLCVVQNKPKRVLMESACPGVPISVTGSRDAGDRGKENTPPPWSISKSLLVTAVLWEKIHGESLGVGFALFLIPHPEKWTPLMKSSVNKISRLAKSGWIHVVCRLFGS